MADNGVKPPSDPKIANSSVPDPDGKQFKMPERGGPSGKPPVTANPADPGNHVSNVGLPGGK